MKHSTTSIYMGPGLYALCALLLGVIPAYAQEEEQRRFADVETTKVKAMSQQLAKKLEPVRDCLAPEPEREGDPVPEPDGRCALKALDRITTSDLPGHEKAEIWNFYGYAYYLIDDRENTKRYYLRVVEEPGANAPLRNRTLKTVAQLYMMDERFDLALRYYEEWMSFQEFLGAPDFALLATIFYNLDRRNEALSNIETAIEMRESAGKIGQENWYAIQRSIYYQRGDFRTAISILKKLIVNYPDVRYWRELGGMHAELEESPEQLAAYAVAYLQDGLTSSSQVVGLAYMYLGAEVPYKAAEIIAEGIDSGEVEETERNFQVAGSAYYQAGELAEALVWMEKAAQKAEDGESYARLASIYVDLERYRDSLRTADEALRRGGIRRRDLALMTKGTAEFNLQRFDDAIRTFRRIRDQRSTRSRDRWIQYVQNEMKREKQIRASGIDLDRILGRS